MCDFFLWIKIAEIKIEILLLYCRYSSQLEYFKKRINMPTMKQVDEMISQLASEFDFSEREARIFLNLPSEIKTSPRPATTKENAKPRGRPPKADPNQSVKAAKKSPTSTPRGPSAYNLYVKANSAKVKAALEKALGPGGKLERGAVMKELGAKWKALSDSQRAKWAA